jgi:o-succinylbenzoate synthase
VPTSGVHVYTVEMATRFRGITVREGLLIAGDAGWGEFSPFLEYDDVECVPWLRSAIEAATIGWPAPIRSHIPVNSIIPEVDPQLAFDMTAAAGCGTAKVKVAGNLARNPDSAGEDQARVEAVRAALGPQGRIRVDANGGWDVDTAVLRLRELDRAAGGLEYAEQPCATIDELAAVRRRIDVPIAADESIRRAQDPLTVALAGAADIAVIKCAPLGGVRRSLEVAEACGLPCVVSSAVETSIGLAAQVALAAALPELDYACGLGTLSLLRADVVPPESALIPVGGVLAVPSAPLVPSAAALERLRPADPARESWWRDRLRRVEAAAVPRAPR